MKILDGKMISEQVFDEVRESASELKRTAELVPGLAVVIIGDDPASKIYVNRKVKVSTELGFYSRKHELSRTASQEDVVSVIADLNQDPLIHGILVQSPPPPQISEREIIDTIEPTKDVDCFTPSNVGKLMIGDEDGFYPCTPAGIMVLLNRYQVETVGRHAVVLGRSNIVGKPMATLLSRKNKNANATVTLCHSRSTNIEAITRTADIVIAALGKAEFLTGDMVKDGAVVIDVGINRVDDSTTKKGYRLVGDVDFGSVSEKASYITPVPGGVGPMTIAMLMYNTYKACCLQHRIPIDKPIS